MPEQEVMHFASEERAIFDEMDRISRDERRSVGILSMSQSGYYGMPGYCRRKRILAAYGVPSQWSETHKRVLARGYIVEWLVVNLVLKKLYPRGKHNYIIPMINTNYRQVGHPDYERPDWIAEIKGISVDKVLDGPQLPHVCQLNQYLGYRKKKAGRLYYFKDGREFRLVRYDIMFDQNLFDKCESEAQHLHDRYLRGEDFGDEGCFKEGVATDYVLEKIQKHQIPEPLPKIEYPCVWWTRQYQMRCQYFDWCWEKADSKSRDFPKAEEGHIQVVQELYAAQNAYHKAQKQWQRAKGTVRAVGCLGGHVIGNLYVDRRFSVRPSKESEEKAVK